MKKNYYEILEVDKKASKEIIKKAYSTLVKKYHPDLQPNDIKKIYEEKLKLINEAYETLSDDNKRINYNETIIDESTYLKHQIKVLSDENQLLKSQLSQLQTIYGDSPDYTNNFSSLNNFNNHNNADESVNTSHIKYYSNPSYKSYNNDEDEFHSSTNYNKFNSFIIELLKKILSFILTCLFFYIMLRIFFHF